MPRPALSLEYQNKIAELMENSGIDNASLMTKVLKSWAISQGWNDYPSERTVRRWMSKFNSGGMEILKRQKSYSWPGSMGEGPLSIQWSDSRIALDCLKFYIEKEYGRPSIGLTQWFVRVSHADPGQAVQQRALMAEVMWCADILEHTKGYARPSTEVEEFKLAFQTWHKEADSIDLLIEKFHLERFSVHGKIRRFLMQMPLFASEFQKVSNEKETLMKE